jgi:Mg2+ and Co2+ transporter CorA
MISAIAFEGEKAVAAPDWHDRLGDLDRSTLLSIDVDPSPSDAEDLTRTLELSEESQGRIAKVTANAFFRDCGHYLHLTLLVPGEGNASAAATVRPIECLAGERWVVTAHQEPVAVLDEFAGLAEGSGEVGRMHGPAFLATLFEWVLYEYVRAFLAIETRLERDDVEAMTDPPADAEAGTSRLVALRQDVGALRRALMTHQRALAALAHPELEALGSEESAERFTRLLELFENTVNAARDARDQVVGSFDILLARTGQRTNDIVKVLTITSVMLLPGTALAGVMGMNFKVGLFSHPEYFWVVVGVAVAIALSTLVAARWKRWM